MTEEEKIKQISDYHGYEEQAWQCIEEMAELTQAINKHRRKAKRNKNNYKLRQNIYEEIADVEVCLEHMKYLLNCHDEVAAMKSYKLDRELKRIKKGMMEMNLYNIYDSESGLCLGQKKTVDQIMNLFGADRGGIYQAASRGYNLNGKYRLEVVHIGRGKRHSLNEADIKVMADWDATTEKARQYFSHVRSKQRKFEQG